jgi:hypothetical protein
MNTDLPVVFGLSSEPDGPKCNDGSETGFPHVAYAGSVRCCGLSKVESKLESKTKTRTESSTGDGKVPCTDTGEFTFSFSVSLYADDGSISDSRVTLLAATIAIHDHEHSRLSEILTHVSSQERNRRD